jgi:NADH:ubiquinone oxidoreductase subunit D
MLLLKRPKANLVFFLFLMDCKTFSVSYRAPGFYHLQGIEHMARGQKLADVVTILGT